MERERAEDQDDRLPVHYLDPRFGAERLARLETELHPRIRLTTGPDLPADPDPVQVEQGPQK